MDTDKGKKRFYIMCGLMLAMLMASLDSTIVGTAMKSIIEELNSVSSYTLPITAYLVCSTIATPISGKLSDIIGRKIIYLTGIGIFFTGSILCGASQNIIELICFRGIQGIGGGIIISSTYSMVGEMVEPRERGKYMGIISSTYGISSVIGPLIGGLITDNLGWRWIFYCNIPLAIISILLNYKNLPNVKREIEGKIDYLGIVTLIIMLAPLLIVLNLGGSTYSWLSFKVILMIIISILFLLIFVLVERKAQQPIMPLKLFSNSVFLVSVLLSFLSYMVMMGVIIFIPLYIQGVLGTAATNSGMLIMPMTLAMVMSSIISGKIISRTCKYKIQGIIGFVLIIFGTLMLLSMGMETSQVYLAITMFITGLGLGTTFPIFNVASQNQFSIREIGVVTSGIQFFRNMGSSIGTAVFGCIFSMSLKNGVDNFDWTSIPDNVKKLMDNRQTMSNPRAVNEIIKGLNNSSGDYINKIIDGIKEMFFNSIHSVFLSLVIIALICLALSFLLKEYTLNYKKNSIITKQDIQ